jgi:hypothetical protein
MGVLCVASPAAASCARFHAGDIYLTYDPLGTEAAGQIVRPITLSVSRPSSGDTSASTVTAQFVDFDSIQVTHVGSHGPVYSIYGDQQVLVDRTAPPLRQNQVFTHAMPSGKSGAGEQIHGLQLILDGGQDIAAGTYEERLEVQYRCDATPHGADVDIQPAVLRVRVEVPSKIIANLAGGSVSGTVDFADFSNLSRSTSVNVYSTGPYALRIDSANNGAMRIPGSEANGPNSRIAYTLNFRGQAVQPGRRYQFQRSGIGGEASPLTVTAEPVQAKRSGVYHDTLTLTFTPLALL